MPWSWRILRWCAFFMFVYYVGWNLYFLAQGRLAPSILTGATGIPSPTTGGTRSLQALLRGDWLESLRCHPLTVPLIGWYALTVGLLVTRVCQKTSITRSQLGFHRLGLAARRELVD